MLRNKKSFFTLFSTVSFALLLLLSPCTIRNSIQSAFGVPQTSVSNVSKTTVSQSECVTAELTKFQAKHINHSNLINTASAFFTSVFAVVEVESKIQLFQDKNWIHTIPVVPSYILYQNFRAFL